MMGNGRLTAAKYGFASFSIDSNPDLLIDSNPVQFIILFIILKDSQGAEKQLTVVPEKMQ